MAEAMRDFLTAWENHRILAEDYRELDDDRVLVVVPEDVVHPGLLGG
jgi:hypothetical protein